MAKLKPFGSARTLVGTLMAVGLTPKDNSLVPFVVFDLNGAIEQYIIPSIDSYFKLCNILSSRISSTENIPLTRDDLHIQLIDNHYLKVYRGNEEL